MPFLLILMVVDRLEQTLPYVSLRTKPWSSTNSTWHDSDEMFQEALIFGVMFFVLIRGHFLFSHFV